MVNVASVKCMKAPEICRFFENEKENTWKHVLGCFLSPLHYISEWKDCKLLLERFLFICLVLMLKMVTMRNTFLTTTSSNVKSKKKNTKIISTCNSTLYNVQIRIYAIHIFAHILSKLIRHQSHIMYSITLEAIWFPVNGNYDRICWVFREHCLS